MLIVIARLPRSGIPGRDPIKGGALYRLHFVMPL
jgi:hypothetical protein